MAIPVVYAMVAIRPHHGAITAVRAGYYGHGYSTGGYWQADIGTAATGRGRTTE